MVGMKTIIEHQVKNKENPGLLFFLFIAVIPRG